MAYALKLDGRVVPLTGMIEPEVLINGGRNTILYEQDQAVRDGVFKLFATNHSPESGARTLRDLLCCLPRVAVPADLGYANIFRVLIVQFIDAYSFDVRSVKKTCIHIVHPDGLAYPLRHLQPLLSRRARANPPRSAPQLGGSAGSPLAGTTAENRSPIR